MTNIAWKALCGSTAGLALALAQLAATPVETTDYDIGSIHITKPWARATPKGAASGAAYMTITNNGKTPDRVTCVSSEASAECQIHTMTMDNGVMKMRPVEGGLEIKPGETVALKPSGVHMMLIDLKHPLEQGKTAAGNPQIRACRHNRRRVPHRCHRGDRARRAGGRRAAA
jgi:periplasmic copper chaperone A